MISVIVPMYNSERYLRECLSSALKQTYENIELLLVDDGSGDNTSAICHEFMKEDLRIRLFTQKHQGVSAARNMALNVAQGEYIFFLDSDDVMEPFILEVFLEQMILQKAEMALCRYQRAEKCLFDEAGHMDKHRKWLYFSSCEIIDRFSKNNGVFGGVGGKLVEKKAIGDLRFDERLVLGEDTLFLYKLFQKGISAVYTTDDLYYYRKNETGFRSLRFTVEGIAAAGNVYKEIEAGEQMEGRIDNARAWEGEYLRTLKRAIHSLNRHELKQMKKQVARELKNPYFREREWRTKGSIFLAFFCPTLYQGIKYVKNSVKNVKERCRKV